MERGTGICGGMNSFINFNHFQRAHSTVPQQVEGTVYVGFCMFSPSPSGFLLDSVVQLGG